jgi:hypothetical protein
LNQQALALPNSYRQGNAHFIIFQMLLFPTKLAWGFDGAALPLSYNQKEANPYERVLHPEVSWELPTTSLARLPLATLAARPCPSAPGCGTINSGGYDFREHAGACLPGL